MSRSLASFGRDLRFGVRSLRHTPWYAASVIGVMASGIALATVVFAIVDGVLFKPLPYPRADELHLIRVDESRAPRPEPPLLTGREAAAWIDAVPVAAITKVGSTSGIGRLGTRDYFSATVDERFFDVVGIRPRVGGFTNDDFAAGNPEERDRERFPRAVISHSLWMTATGGSRDIIDHRLAFNAAGDRGVRVAGVLPPDFVFPLNVESPLIGTRQPDVLLPMPRLRAEGLDWPGFLVLARIPRHAVIATVREQMQAATVALTLNPPSSAYLTGHPGDRRPPYDLVTLEAVAAHLGSRERPAFSLVAAATGLLLALVCVNVAGLTAARNIHRRRDIAIRRALGATGWMLGRSLFAELLVLACAAAALALLVSPALLDWTIGLLPETVTLLKQPGLDARVFASAALIAIASAVLVVVWPALMAARAGTFSPGWGDASTTRTGRRSGMALLSAQAALGFVLLTAAGLTLASIASAWRSDVGYRRERIVIFEAFLKDWATTANDSEHVVALHDALQRVPGVINVATTDASLRLFARSSGRLWSGVKAAGASGPPQGLASRNVSAEFFDVMGLRIVEGEAPTAATWDTDRLAVVSESAARLLWPDRSAIGQQLVPDRPDPRRPAPWRVAAVIRDARYRAIDQEPVADVYLPDRIQGGRYGAFFVVQTSSDPDALIPALLAVSTARGFFTETVAPLEDALFATMRPRFLPAWLFGSLGALALLVLAAGIAGLLAMTAAQRARELVIRVALGASTGRVLRLLARDQLAAVAIGIAVGSLVSLWATQYLQAHLYGVTPREPTLWAGVALVMMTVAALGAFVPAARAARANPADALREP